MQQVPLSHPMHEGVVADVRVDRWRHLDELVRAVAAREALLRRSGGEPYPEVIKVGELEIDVAARIVLKGGERVDLAPRELDLLLALIEHKGRVVSRQHLLSEVWGHQGEVVTRTVDTHIAELRRKLEPDTRKPSYIQTARKAGYRFEAP